MSMIDAAARAINHAPTDGQKEAGNYRKAHVSVHGLPITIENGKGSHREGVGKDGKPWKSKLPAHYGYFKKTEGKDGDHVDCYVGPDLDAENVYVVNQADPETGRFDEHKVMLGYYNRRAALDDYEAAFSDGLGRQRIGSVREMSIPAFKAWIENGNHKKAARAHGGRVGDQDQQKVSKEEANYRDRPRAGERCSGCSHFESPAGCEHVRGDIKPYGWCEWWNAKTKARAIGGSADTSGPEEDTFAERFSGTTDRGNPAPPLKRAIRWPTTKSPLMMPRPEPVSHPMIPGEMGPFDPTKEYPETRTYYFADGGGVDTKLSHFDDAVEALKLTPQEQNLYKHHLGNLRQGGVQRHDLAQPGQPVPTSTLYATTMSNGDGTYVIPTVWNNKLVDPNQAWKNAEKEGLHNFPVYPDQDTASRAYHAMHGFMEQDLGDPFGGANVTGVPERQGGGGISDEDVFGGGKPKEEKAHPPAVAGGISEADVFGPAKKEEKPTWGGDIASAYSGFADFMKRAFTGKLIDEDAMREFGKKHGIPDEQIENSIRTVQGRASRAAIGTTAAGIAAAPVVGTALTAAGPAIQGTARQFVTRPIEEAGGPPAEVTEGLFGVAAAPFGARAATAKVERPPRPSPVGIDIQPTPEMVKRAQAAREFGTELTAGQAAQDPALLREEELAARGASGEAAQKAALAARERQGQQIAAGREQVRQSVTRGEQVPAGPEAGGLIGTEVGAAAERARGVVGEAERKAQAERTQAEQLAAQETAQAQAQAQAESAAQRQMLQDQGRVIGDTIRGSQPAIETPREMGAIVGETAQQQAARDRQGYQNLYGEAFNREGAMSRGFFDNLGTRIQGGLTSADEPVFIDAMNTPGAASLIDRLNNTEKLGLLGEGPINLRQVEQVRKQLNRAYTAARTRGPAGAEDARAIGAIINEYDNRLVNSVTEGLLTGDPNGFLTDIQRARGEFARYVRTWRPQRDDFGVGKSMRVIADRNATPEEVANLVLGTGRIGVSGNPVRLYERLEGTLGADSPAINSIRQAIFQKASQVFDTQGNINIPRSAQSLLEFANSSLARRVFSEPELAAMREHAQAMRSLEQTVSQLPAVRRAEAPEQLPAVQRAAAPEQLPAVQAATRMRQAYEQLFEPEAVAGAQRTALGKIVAGTATSQEVAHAVAGGIGSGASVGNIQRMIQAIERITGTNSPSMAAARSLVWERLSSNQAGGLRGAQASANMIRQFLDGPGAGIARTLFTKSELDMMRRYAENVLDPTVLGPGARVQPDTSPVLIGRWQKAMNDWRGAIGATVGAVLEMGLEHTLGHGLTSLGIPPGMSTIAAGWLGKKIAERRGAAADVKQADRVRRLYDWGTATGPIADQLRQAESNVGDARMALQPLQRQVISRDKSGRPIRTAPVAAQSPILERGYERATEQTRPGGAGRDQGVAAPPRAPAQALSGLPAKPINLGEGRTYTPGPHQPAHDAAWDYARTAGIEYNPPRTYAKVDPERATRIAQAFEEMPHNPADPRVKASYEAMARETLAQWEAVKKTGLKVDFLKPGQEDPYASNPRAVQQDVRENNHMWVFPTAHGFGTPEGPGAPKFRSGTGMRRQLEIEALNPMLQRTDEVINGHPAVVNDIFRIVHDYFGHIKDGVGFRADGEENAWRSHAAMYSPEARPAMTAETRGQNSWVNFGPHAEANKGASAADTVYAPQKQGMLPDWVMEEGRLDPGMKMMPQLRWTMPKQTMTPEQRLDLLQKGYNKVQDLAVNKILAPAFPKKPPGSSNVPEIGAALNDRGQNALRKMGIESGRIDWDTARPEENEMLSHAMASEVEAALTREGSRSATGWYSTKMQRMHDIAGVIYPELKTDPNARAGMVAALAIASQGEKVRQNAALMTRIYEHFRDNGRFPEDFTGSKVARIMNGQFEKLNALIDEGGVEGMHKFLNTDFRVGDLRKMGYTIEGGVDDIVPGASILGPKIGGGFYANLSGNFDRFTMDLWWMRGFGRLTGTLIGRPIQAPFDKFTKLLRESGERAPRDREKLVDRAEAIVDEHERNFRKYREEYDSGKRVKTPLVKAAERAYEAARGLNQMPLSGGQRNWMVGIAQRARDILSNRGVDIKPADMQAVWWYPEKDLYEKLGGKPERLNLDFADALHEIALKRGFTEEDIERAISSGHAAGGRDRSGPHDQGTEHSGRQKGGRVHAPQVRGHEPSAGGLYA